MRIAVIGAGVFGSAVGYFLARHSVEDVTGVRADGRGVTMPRSVGIVRHHYSLRGHVELARRGREILEEFATYTG